MSLSDRLKEKQCRVATVTVDGLQFKVTGKTKRERGALFAQARDKNGNLNSNKLESLLLEACVCDASDGSKCKADEWDTVPSHITAPLVAEIMRVCGLDKEDIDPKDSDSTAS